MRRSARRRQPARRRRAMKFVQTGKAAYLLSLLHEAFCLVDRGNDVRIGRAPAQIAAHILADFRVAAGAAFAHAADRRHDLSGGAVAALESVMVDEGLLHGMQRPIWTRQALD